VGSWGRDDERPQPRKVEGRIGFMPPDGVFIAARDILDHVPLRIRIIEVVEYPKGTPIGGRPSPDPFNALIYEARAKKGNWVRARKPLRLNNTNQMKLFIRFGAEVSWWEQREITLNLAPTRDPSGGKKSGFKLVYGIVIAPEADEATEEQVAEKMRRALRGECPYQPAADPAPEREPGDDDEPLQDDTDTAEPPDEAELAVPTGEP
jgi:hypothetical protein